MRQSRCARLAAGVADELEGGEQEGEQTGGNAAKGEDEGEPAGVGNGSVRGVAAEEDTDGRRTDGAHSENAQASDEELAGVGLHLE